MKDHVFLGTTFMIFISQNTFVSRKMFIFVCVCVFCVLELILGGSSTVYPLSYHSVVNHDLCACVFMYAHMPVKSREQPSSCPVGAVHLLFFVTRSLIGLLINK